MEDQNKYVLGAQQGDQDALTELYQQTHHMAFFTAMRYVKNEADAADVVQNAYIAAFSKLDTFDPSRGFEPWLRKIVVNQALNFLRGKKVTFVGEDLIEEIMDDDDIVPAHYLEQKEKREKILEIVNDLPDGQRLAITLFYFEEMSIAEIAETMGVKPATAKSHLHFGRKTIKAAILEEERKGNKLYVFLPLPALTRIFHLEAQAARMPEALSQAVWNGITQSSSAFGVSTTPAATPSPKPAAKALTSSASVKIIAGVVTLGVVTSAIVLTRNLSSHQDEAEPAAAVVEEQADREEEASSQEASAEEQVEADPVEEAVPTAFETQWTDTRLEATVREQLSLESGTIMSTDLEAVTSLAFVGPDAVVVNESAEFSYVYEINSETMSITPTTNATLSHYGRHLQL